MAVDVEPAELARLLDLAERPRVENWSLRAALTRYAQPQPQRASNIIELVRRTESAIGRHSKTLERDGPALWDALQAGDEAPSDGLLGVLGLLRAMVELDRLGDSVAEWAVARAVDRPDALVDTVVESVARRLEELGVPREERPRPTGRRG